MFLVDIPAGQTEENDSSQDIPVCKQYFFSILRSGEISQGNLVTRDDKLLTSVARYLTVLRIHETSLL